MRVLEVGLVMPEGGKQDDDPLLKARDALPGVSRHSLRSPLHGVQSGAKCMLSTAAALCYAVQQVAGCTTPWLCCDMRCILSALPPAVPRGLLELLGRQQLHQHQGDGEPGAVPKAEPHGRAAAEAAEGIRRRRGRHNQLPGVRHPDAGARVPARVRRPRIPGEAGPGASGPFRAGHPCWALTEARRAPHRCLCWSVTCSECGRGATSGVMHGALVAVADPVERSHGV